MGATHNIDGECGLKFNGVDILQLSPVETNKAIMSLPKDQQEIVKAMIKTKIMSTKFPLEDNYASHAGRPSLSKVPYMKSENDGYPFLRGHSPQCDGRIAYNKGGPHLPPNMCWCKWATKSR